MPGDPAVGMGICLVAGFVLGFGLVQQLARPADRTELRHAACESCGRVICWCRDHADVTSLCPGTVEHGCTHDRALCVDCKSACSACVDDLLTEDVWNGVTW